MTSSTAAIQAAAAWKAFWIKTMYILLNALALFVPFYLLNSYAVYKSLLYDTKLATFTIILVSALVLVGILLELARALHYSLRIVLLRRRIEPEAICYARLFRDIARGLKAVSGMIVKDEEGIAFVSRRGKQRLGSDGYRVTIHGEIGLHVYFIVRRVKIRPYLSIESEGVFRAIDVLAPNELLDLLKENA